jgi:hypothetical protein
MSLSAHDSEVTIERVFKPDIERQLAALASLLGLRLLPPPPAKAAPLPGSIASKRIAANRPIKRRREVVRK